MTDHKPKSVLPRGLSSVRDSSPAPFCQVTNPSSIPTMTEGAGRVMMDGAVCNICLAGQLVTRFVHSSFFEACIFPTTGRNESTNGQVPHCCNLFGSTTFIAKCKRNLKDRWWHRNPRKIFSHEKSGEKPLEDQR